MNAIYAGHVAHARPGKHRLRYSVFMLAIDLDDIGALAARLRPPPAARRRADGPNRSDGWDDRVQARSTRQVRDK